MPATAPRKRMIGTTIAAAYWLSGVFCFEEVPVDDVPFVAELGDAELVCVAEVEEEELEVGAAIVESNI
jgi:hypothetical protein